MKKGFSWFSREVRGLAKTFFSWERASYEKTLRVDAHLRKEKLFRKRPHPV